MMRILYVMVALLFSGLFAPGSAYAQRYLSEFVGTAQVASGRDLFAIDTNLSFTELDGRRLDGSFSYIEQDSFGDLEVDLFSADATLAASGQCPARIYGDGADGHLHLTEYTFDANVFALKGEVDLDEDPGEVKLAEGRLSGPVALLRPPAPALAITSEKGALTLESGEEYTVLFGEQEEDGTVRAELTDASGAVVFDVVIASGETWLYIVGVGGDLYMMARGKVEVDERGAVSGASGDFDLLYENNKLDNSGSFRLEL